MPSIQAAFWILLAVLFLVGMPIFLVWSMSTISAATEASDHFMRASLARLAAAIGPW
jgi:hypothetical protein